jgi:hypothetical protein
MIPGYVEFEFDLPGALLRHLISILDGLTPAPLTAGDTERISEQQGVYQLLLDGKIVYIGKTDAEAGLRNRLQRHAGKVQQRLGLDPGRLTFRAVRIFVFTAMDLETQLIKHYAGDEDSTAWNNSGFGSNDPGRNRDRTIIKGKNFDAQYPIDIDLPLGLTFPGETTAAIIASALKDALPYTFRFESRGPRSRAPHPQLTNAVISIPPTATTTREIVTTLTQQLPAGWQATAFRSHVILYRESVDNYPDAQVLARSVGE